MRLRDRYVEEIVLNLFSILLLEARLWCEYFPLFLTKSNETFPRLAKFARLRGNLQTARLCVQIFLRIGRFSDRERSELTAKIACDTTYNQMGKIKEEVQSGSLLHTRVLFFIRKGHCYCLSSLAIRSAMRQRKRESERKSPKKCDDRWGQPILFLGKPGSSSRQVSFVERQIRQVFFVARFIEFSTNLFDLLTLIQRKKRDRTQNVRKLT